MITMAPNPYDAYYSYQPAIYGQDIYSQYGGYYPDQYVSPAYYTDESYSYSSTMIRS